MSFQELSDTTTYIASKTHNRHINESTLKIDSAIKNTDCLDFVSLWLKNHKYTVLEKNYDSIVLFQTPPCFPLNYFTKNDQMKASSLKSLLLYCL